MRPHAQGVLALLASLLLAGVAVMVAVAPVAARSSNLGNDDSSADAPLALPALAPLVAPAGSAPSISIVRIVTPSELPVGGGHVDFAFFVTNPGNVPLSSVKVTDRRCPGISFSGGDANSNSRLDPGETWRYRCGGRLSATITDSATATGVHGSVVVRDSDQVTVPVGLKRPALHLESMGRPSLLQAGGGPATFAYVVTNVGNVVIAGVTVTDSACAPVRYVSGDTNLNGRLELSETWRFSCTTMISKSRTGNARVLGNVDGSGLHDDATETVAVAGTAPSIEVDARAIPASLPAGGGSVTYTFIVTNTGSLSLTDITIAATTCAGATLVGGDVNANRQLDISETWRYTCSALVSSSVTATVIVAGRTPPMTVTATATTSVTVAAPAAAPAIALTVRAAPDTLPASGGSVAYTYTVWNPGEVALSGITVTDDACGDIRMTEGDLNGDRLLDPAETWLFTCTAAVFSSRTDRATVIGEFAGETANAAASAPVVVAGLAPSPTPTPTPPSSPTSTPTPASSPASTPTPSPSAAATPTSALTPAPTVSPTPSPTQAPTAPPTQSPIPTESPPASSTESSSPSATSTPSAPVGGSVAGVTSPPKATAGPGQIGTGQGSSTPSVPALILILLIGIIATGLILRLSKPAPTH